MSSMGNNGWIFAALGLVMGACALDERSDGVGDTEGQVGTQGISADGTGAEGDGTAEEPKLDLGSDDGPPQHEECAAITEHSEVIPAPADIIFVVDNSGSMTFEAEEIQARMNDFSSQIIDSGVDVSVTLVSSYPGNGNGICIDAPLGFGNCPTADDRFPHFIHVDAKVGSHDAWKNLLETHEEWATMLRPDSTKHIVVVTDDTSDMEWEEFKAELVELDPSYVDFVHHSVVCHSDCESAAGIGENYIALSNESAGVAADLCNQDFQGVFDVLSTEVIGGSELACEFEIPTPPGDLEFDPDEVNLEFDDGQGGVLPIGRVESPFECASVMDGWHYDNPADPTMIVLCPQTCEKVQGVVGASIQIEFGCASVRAG
ncbi:MAG: hypothetical protein K0V04_10915 [Deltaproteobacteria bacterium]|nr:hypothetical protein [Deltaproteobacteria bacterium]